MSEQVTVAARAYRKVAGVGGDRALARQDEFIRKRMRFVTANSEIAFILAEGSGVIDEWRRALQD